MVLLTGAVSDVAGVHAALARSTAMNDTVKVSAAATRRTNILGCDRLHPPNPFHAVHSAVLSSATRQLVPG